MSQKLQCFTKTLSLVSILLAVNNPVIANDNTTHHSPFTIHHSPLPFAVSNPVIANQESALEQVMIEAETIIAEMTESGLSCTTHSNKFPGTWSTHWRYDNFELQLYARGTGIYKRDNGIIGILRGQFSLCNRLFKGTWTEQANGVTINEGEFVYLISIKGDRFTGAYTWTGQEGSKYWNGRILMVNGE